MMDEGTMQDGKLVLVRDYSDGVTKLLAQIAAKDAGKDPPDTDLFYRVLQNYERRRARPHIILPENRQAFDGLVSDCNDLMKAFYGKMTAVLNYEDHQAYITMECDCVEFRSGAFMRLLQKVTKTAAAICFIPNRSNMLCILIDVPCFIPDPEYRGD